MRTKITLVLLLSLITFASYAQFPPYYFGLKAAPQISWMRPNTDSYTSEGAKIGFAWGFIAEFNFTENHCIATGFNMQFNGGKLKFPGMQTTGSDTLYGDISRNYALKYIEVPLTLKMRTNAINNMKYFGRIGLGTAFKIGAKATDEFTAGLTSPGEKANYDDIAFVRESLIVGMGVEYQPKGGPVLGAELSFNNGFTNILTGNNTVDPSVSEKANLNLFELAFSVIF